MDDDSQEFVEEDSPLALARKVLLALLMTAVFSTLAVSVAILS